MKKDKSISFIIELSIIIVIFFCIIIVGYINRDSIYKFLSKKANEDTYEVLNANNGNIHADEQGGIDETEPPPPTPPPTEPPTTEIVTETTAETPEETTEETTEEPTVPAPAETLPPEEATDPTIDTTNPPYVAADVPDPNFIQAMFAGSIEIPGSEDKIEAPPAGRSEDLQYGAVPLSENIPNPSEYFKNVLFLGDSVTTGFDLYRNSIKFNGEAVMKDITVVAVGSYGVYNATREVSNKSIHPLFEGKQTLPEDIIAKKEAKNVFICLGLNDIVWEKTQDFINYYVKLINNIKAKSPDKNIVIMSITPVVAGQTTSAMTNDMITAANNALLELAKYNGIPFIDYGAALRDSGNNLYSELSSDGYCHLKIEAYNRIVEYMLYHPLKN